MYAVLHPDLYSEVNFFDGAKCLSLAHSRTNQPHPPLSPIGLPPNNGQRSGLTLDGYAANDPYETCPAQDCCAAN
jgi:hypothetical protein